MKKTIRLTESDLHRVIRESVKRVLSEAENVIPMMLKVKEEAEEALSRCINNMKRRGGYCLHPSLKIGRDEDGYAMVIVSVPKNEDCFYGHHPDKNVLEAFEAFNEDMKNNGFIMDTFHYWEYRGRGVSDDTLDFLTSIWGKHSDRMTQQGQL